MKRAPQHTPILALGLAAAIFLMAASSVMLIHVPTAIGAQQELPIYSVERSDKKIAVTIDTAWGDEHMKAVLDLLDQYQVKVTFFLVKSWADQYPDLVTEISSRGHEIGNHSATHPDMTRLSREQILNEIGSTADRIEELTGTRPTLFRPPFGSCDTDLVETARELGIHTVQWSIDSLDWKNINAQQIAERVCREVKPGSIILFQNNAQYIESYLPDILKRLKAGGYEIVPAGQMIYPDSFRVDHRGRQLEQKNGNPESE